MIDVTYQINNSSSTHSYKSVEEAIKDININMINMMPEREKITNLSSTGFLKLLYIGGTRTTTISAKNKDLQVYFSWIK